MRPLSFPLSPPRVVVVDADVLARCACREAGGRTSVASELIRAGQAPLYTASHVPHEVDRCLPAVAAGNNPPVPLDAAFTAWDRIRSGLRVVELPIGEYLRPEIGGIRRCWRAGADHDPSRLDGDPSDLGTAALAAFLGDSVILSGDQVFTRHGLRSTLDWCYTAGQLMVAARIGGSWNAGLMITVGAGQATASGTSALICQLKRRPWVGLVLVGAGLLAWRGLSERQRFAARRVVNQVGQVGRVGRVAGELVERAVASLETYRVAVDQIVVVRDPDWREPTDVERCARVLAVRGCALAPAELRDDIRAELGDPRWGSAARIDRELAAHPAFHRLPGGRWVLGAGAGDAVADR